MARSLVWACRFKQLKLARATFLSAESPTILSRPFFGYDLFLDVSRSDTHRLLYLEGERFVEEYKLLAAIVRRGYSVIDVGANIGYYLLMFEHLAGKDGQLFCFEPEPDNLLELKRNIENNQLTNVTLFEAGVGDKDGRTRLACGLNGMISEDNGGEIDVNLLRLDTVINQKIDMMKIDVEGYEGQVLSGARCLIKKFRPSLFVEVHPVLLSPTYSTKDILGFAEELYKNVRFYDGHMNGSLDSVRSRYTNNRVKEIKDKSRLLERREVFWMVCN